MSRLVEVVEKAVNHAAESMPRKARLLVLHALDFCRTATLDELPAHVRPTLIALAKCADANGVCWPSYRVLAEYTGRTRRTVMRHVAQLSAFVTKELRFFVGHRSPEQPLNRSNKYHVHVPRVSRAARRGARSGSTSSEAGSHVEQEVPRRVPESETPPRRQVACSERCASDGATRPVPGSGSRCAGRGQSAVEDAGTDSPSRGQLSEKAAQVLRALRSASPLATIANEPDAMRLWEIASNGRCTVADVERAIADLVKKTPAGVRLSRERAWGRIVAFVEAAPSEPRGAPEAPRETAQAELRRDAEDRRRDEDARRGAVPMPPSIIAQLRERNLLPAPPS